MNFLQSRLYNTSGGTSGEQDDSNLYRDLIQREISDLEHAPNLWKTFNYNFNSKFHISAGVGFGGYKDWLYDHFYPKISIRSDHEQDFKSFSVGSHGLCIKCGDKTSNGLYCPSYSPIPHFRKDCENESEDLTQVYDFHGNLIYVCDNCLDESNIATNIFILTLCTILAISLTFAVIVFSIIIPCVLIVMNIFITRIFTLLLTAMVMKLIFVLIVLSITFRVMNVGGMFLLKILLTPIMLMANSFIFAPIVWSITTKNAMFAAKFFTLTI